MTAARGRDDGYILVAVLATMVVLTGFLAAGTMVARSALGTARVADMEVASAGLPLGGLEIAAYQLTILNADPALVDGRRIKLTGGIVDPHVVDEGAKVDLNGADPQLLRAIFASVGMTNADDVAAKVVALRGPSAAEAATAINPSVAPPKRRRGFPSVESLADVDGVTRADMRRLRDRLTVFNPDGRVNIVDADRSVLEAIPGITKPQMALVLAARETRDKAAIEKIHDAMPESALFTKVKPGPAYRVRVDATMASGRKKSIEAVVAASKSPNEPYYILDWRD